MQWNLSFLNNKKEHQLHASAMQINRYHQLIIFLLSHGHAIKNSFRKMLRKPASFFITITIIGITVTLPTILFIILNNFQKATGQWYSKPNMTLYLKNNVTPQMMNEIMNDLKHRPEVTKITYISAEQGLEDFKKISDFSDVLPILKKNPLPPAINVIFSHFNPHSQSSIQLLKSLHTFAFIDQSNLNGAWVKKLHYILDIAKRFTITLALFLSIGVILIVSNTIRLITQSHQQEITVLKFIGATSNYFRRPFLYQGLIYGILGGLLALAFAKGIIAFISPPAQRLLKTYHSHFILEGCSLSMAIIIVISAALSGLIGAKRAVQQYINEQNE